MPFRDDKLVLRTLIMAIATLSLSSYANAGGWEPSTLGQSHELPSTLPIGPFPLPPLRLPANALKGPALSHPSSVSSIPEPGDAPPHPATVPDPGDAARVEPLAPGPHTIRLTSAPVRSFHLPPGATVVTIARGRTVAALVLARPPRRPTAPADPAAPLRAFWRQFQYLLGPAARIAYFDPRGAVGASPAVAAAYVERRAAVGASSRWRVPVHFYRASPAMLVVHRGQSYFAPAEADVV